MKKFKISELALFSGVKAHTIRIWEQRFAIFKPGRSDGNVRYYTLEDLKLLLDLSLLIPFGYKISQLFQLPAQQLSHLVDELSVTEAIPCKAINDLIILVYENEIEEFEDVLDGCKHTLGIDDTIKEVVVPFMERVQLLSFANVGLETHFVAVALRKKLFVAIESANPPAMFQKTALLFLPEREYFDLILLYAVYLLKLKGVRVLYLGANVPYQILQDIAVAKQPDYIVTYLPPKQKLAASTFTPFLQQLPATEFLVLEPEPGNHVYQDKSLKFLTFKNLKNLVVEQAVFTFSES